MSKYKVGQQVKIVKRGQAPSLPFGTNTDDMIGMVGTVERYSRENGYWVANIGDVNGYDWFWEDALEAADVTPTPNNQNDELSISTSKSTE